MSIPQSGGGPIERHEQLAEYLADGCKPKEDWRIGTEHEKFGYCKDTLKPLPYAGERSILAVLEGLRDGHGWDPLIEGGNLIGLTKDGANISLEPGGQLELSGAPLETLHQTCAEFTQHYNEVHEVLQRTEHQVALIGFSALAVAILMLVFIGRTVQVPKELGVKEMGFSPGGAVGGFFIPLASWVIPYLAMQEAWKASDPDAEVTGWKEGAKSNSIRLWWLAWSGALILFMVLRTYRGELAGADLGTLVEATFQKLTLTLSFVFLGVCSLLMVRTVSQRSLAKWETMSIDSIPSAKAHKEEA